MSSPQSIVTKSSTSVTPTKPTNTKYTVNMNDPIIARMNENTLTLKKSNLWRRRNNRVQPAPSK